MADKTEQATPFKLRKARERGLVGKSPDLVNGTLLLVCVVLISALWPGGLAILRQTAGALLIMADHVAWQPGAVISLWQCLTWPLLKLWMLLAIAAITVIILATWVQTGMVWSTKALTIDVSRLNPVKGVKRLFNREMLAGLVKTLLKCLVGGAIGILLAQALAPGLATVSRLSPQAWPASLMHQFRLVSLSLLVPLLAMACLDSLYHQRKFARSQRMSKQEVRDEYRQREGSPLIKRKIRQLQKQLREKARQLPAVKHADVIITNPTHLAVALKYDPSCMPAPKVLCKGEGDLALRIRAIARRHGIPVIENRPLAQMIWREVSVNHWILETHYPLAAGIFHALFEARKKHP